MARRSHDEFSNSFDARSQDVSAQFWGSSPAWRTTGTLRRTRRGGERTGPIARTRHHGDPTGQTPVVPVAAIDEPHIDPYDFGFDDVGYAPYVDIRTGIDTRRDSSVRPALEDQPDSVELIELEERPVGRAADSISRLADRLGLGAVDPLLLRLGVIVVIGVLLVPLAIALRPDSSNGSVHTETTAAPSIELVVSGDASQVEDAPVVQPVVAVAPIVGAGNDGSSAQTPQSSEPPAAAPATSQVAAATEQAGSASEAAIAESTGGAGSDVAESVASPQAMVQVETQPTEPAEPAEVAEVAESAVRVPPVCELTYTVAAGDYWIRIAGAAGTTLTKLLAANQATTDKQLFPGEDICLPQGATLPAPPTTTTAAPPTTASAPTTTAAPVPAPTVAPVIAPPLAPAAVEQIIREVWPDDLEGKALEISWRESGYRSGVQNWCCYGLFQIYWNVHKSWLDDLGVTSATQLIDARTNAKVAYAMYQRSGWAPWE